MMIHVSAMDARIWGNRSFPYECYTAISIGDFISSKSEVIPTYSLHPRSWQYWGRTVVKFRNPVQYKVSDGRVTLSDALNEVEVEAEGGLVRKLEEREGTLPLKNAHISYHPKSDTGRLVYFDDAPATAPRKKTHNHQMAFAAIRPA